MTGRRKFRQKNHDPTPCEQDFVKMFFLEDLTVFSRRLNVLFLEDLTASTEQLQAEGGRCNVLFLEDLTCYI